MSAPREGVIVALRRWRRRMRVQALLHAVAAGGAAWALTLMIARPFALAAALAVAAFAVWRGWTRSLVDTAARVETAVSLDNLTVTAAELAERARPIRAELADAIDTLAGERLHNVEVHGVVSIGQPAAVAAVVLAGCVVLAIAGAPQGRPGMTATPSTRSDAEPAAGAIAVDVAPPSYTGRPPERFQDPVQVTALAGSHIRVSSGMRVLREWNARESASLELRATDDGPARFLSVVVVPDAPPVVRIHTPGRDTALATARQPVAIGVETTDDIGLRSLAVRYTKASGGGENVTFTEGEVPIAIERASGRAWTAHAQWLIESLDLADGDVLVYRAVARDRNPSGEPVQSDAFLVEIGRAAEIAGAGFALLTEERKYAISQQMVIYKTEQLLANRAKPAGDFLEHSRMIAMEQRMVRAEVVFLSGGEIEDEVEEAAHSHELAEGRLENPGRAEMLRALNFMSRAEAQLNDGNATDALPLERQALASLERALDRRRYFLRTLPDRSRIDPARRLTGERRDARSWRRSAADPAPAMALDEQRAVMQTLVDAAADPTLVNATLAARVAALDPSSAPLQAAAVAIASSGTDAGRRDAVRGAMQAVTADAVGRLPASAPVTLDVDPLAGRMTDALMSPRPRR